MMSDEKEKKESVAEKASETGNSNRHSSRLAFSLVVTMLGILLVLVFFIICWPLFFPSTIPTDLTARDFMEYYKWALAVLLGTFGAWIGAGAAYFFGKENLKESSLSTEAALKIQQQSFRRPSGIERIKDMTLTAMNSNFIFDFESTKKNVTDGLEKFKGYWFVPVVNKNTGVLDDIIHARVFWDISFWEIAFKDKGKDKGYAEILIEELVPEMDKTELKKLHGDLFYAKVSPNDKISDVHKLMEAKGAEVAIVVDEKGKPSHCLSKTELRTFLKVDST